MALSLIAKKEEQGQQMQEAFASSKDLDAFEDSKKA
jgi:hypothetical protein